MLDPSLVDWLALPYARSESVDELARVEKSTARVEKSSVELLADVQHLFERICKLQPNFRSLHRRQLVELQLQCARLRDADLDLFAKQNQIDSFVSQLRTFFQTLNDIPFHATSCNSSVASNVHAGTDPALCVLGCITKR